MREAECRRLNAGADCTNRLKEADYADRFKGWMHRLDAAGWDNVGG
jgi:hypothetical protein